MPELPEVETTKRGIEAHLLHQTIDRILVHQKRLRYPVPIQLSEHLTGKQLQSVERRAKYILLHFSNGYALLHLGMSGSISIIDAPTPLEKHDHVELYFKSGQILRFNDPRRFGCLLWQENNTHTHPLLTLLGPEPLTPNFSAAYIQAQSRKRKIPVKQFIMDNKVVVGVGNIYASEALFLAGIRPTKKAHLVSKAAYSQLVETIKHVLIQAIQAGGTTIRNFSGHDGKPGYFSQELKVYQQTLCSTCNTAIKQCVIAGRNSFYCPTCQS
jgi:formamidopyrimidine-DNA glycosylase